MLKDEKSDPQILSCLFRVSWHRLPSHVPDPTHPERTKHMDLYVAAFRLGWSLCPWTAIPAGHLRDLPLTVGVDFPSTEGFPSEEASAQPNQAISQLHNIGAVQRVDRTT